MSVCLCACLCQGVKMYFKVPNNILCYSEKHFEKVVSFLGLLLQ